MADTISTMEWRIVDTIAAYQLEVGDYILAAEGEIAELIQVDDYADRVVVVYGDDFGDIYNEEFAPDDHVDIYMLFDE